jgi:hypothetical protein
MMQLLRTQRSQGACRAARRKGFHTRYSTFSPSFSPSTLMRFSPYTLSPIQAAPPQAHTVCQPCLHARRCASQHISPATQIAC